MDARSGKAASWASKNFRRNSYGNSTARETNLMSWALVGPEIYCPVRPRVTAAT